MIAIHNAKYLLGMESTLADTVRNTQKAGGMALFGVFGTYPWKIDDIEGINYKRIEKDDLKKPGVYIITYNYDGSVLNGAHNVAVRVYEDGNKVYNDNVSTITEDYWDIRGFIGGYRVWR